MTIETGIPVQGVISRELLLSIFNTKSPLHDGAVIVQNGMVEAAGCILPLSNTTKYQRHKLGTRHRAALGISEQADILALVVSEETGKITLAEEGTLYMHLSLDKLEKLLKEKLSIESSSDENKPLFSFTKTAKQP
jgi:diadenylate cyclase